VYADMPHPEGGYVWNDEGETSETSCSTDSDETAYELCPADDTIYLGAISTWKFYKLGDAAPAAGIAHEYAHHVQFTVGVPNPTSNQETIVLENQADCIAGSWLAWADDQGHLEEGDLGDVDRLIPLIASAEDDPERNHGTIDERIDSFNLGLQQGLEACNQFYPSAPVYVPAQ
jgi:predicted metalloprotease